MYCVCYFIPRCRGNNQIELRIAGNIASLLIINPAGVDVNINKTIGGIIYDYGKVKIKTTAYPMM
jgi:hypothetical protein